MAGHGEQFSKKQEAAITAVLTCRTLAEAAEQVGIGLTTLHQWLKKPEFKTRLSEARQEVFSQSIGQLKAASVEAVETLRDLLTGSDTVRLRAAVAILDQAHKGIELLEMEERLARLEQLQEKAGALHG